MFQKIKDIKKYIRLAKIGGLAFAVIFMLLLAYTFYQAVQIRSLETRIEFLEMQYR